LILARRRLAGLSNCQFVEADAYDLAKVVCEPVDFVFLANVFHGARERTRLSRLVAQVLRPAGSSPSAARRDYGAWRAAVPTPNRECIRAAVKEAVESSGLRLVRVVEVSPYPAVFKKLGDATG
jgi:hypothetical protein